jgi:hypothetical protein
MPNLRQLLIGAALLMFAIVAVAGIALLNSAHPLGQHLGQQDAENAAAEIFNVDMGVSAEVS